MNLIEQVESKLVQEILAAVAKAGVVAAQDVPEIEIESPKDKAHGDYSTNVAMQLTRIAKRNPREIAQEIIDAIDLKQAGATRAEIAGPGFINFFMDKSYLQQIIPNILKAQANYGRSELGNGKKIQVEFVSANPTGSLHLGHARGAAVGDALSNILDFAGYDVTREYYINDAGNQIENLAYSIEARYKQALGMEAEMPADGYYGDDIVNIAEELAQAKGKELLEWTDTERFEFLRSFGLEKQLEQIKLDLNQFRVNFDVWYSETSLYETGKVEAVLEQLQERGSSYEEDGATWLDTVKYGDDKNRVLIKSDGSYTYLTPDIAYHQHKFARGFDTVINIWGADHHGYVPRMKAAMQALGYEADRLEVLISQMVSLYQNGEKVKMSKRTGKAVTMKELMEEVGVDATRYFFIMRSIDSHLDFDLDLALSQSNENPVYYVQYAHARICSVFRQAEEQGVETELGDQVDFSLLHHEREYDLMNKLAAMQAELEAAATQAAPHRMVRYVYELAAMFHSYYRAERVITEDASLTAARLGLLKAIQIVIQNGLKLIGVTAPERM